MIVGLALSIVRPLLGVITPPAPAVTIGSPVGFLLLLTKAS